MFRCYYLHWFRRCGHCWPLCQWKWCDLIFLSNQSCLWGLVGNYKCWDPQSHMQLQEKRLNQISRTMKKVTRSFVELICTCLSLKKTVMSLLDNALLQGPFSTEMSSNAMSPRYPRPVMPSNTTCKERNSSSF